MQNVTRCRYCLYKHYSAFECIHVQLSGNGGRLMKELVGEDGVESPPDNMAEKMMAYFSEKPKPDPGRPLAIDDGRLWGARDHLVWLFEETWPDVGERLPWIKKPADVLDAIRVWDNPNLSTGNHYIAKCLLRPSSIPVTQKWLSARRSELG